MTSIANRNYSPSLGIRFDAYFCTHPDRLPDAALRQMGIARADIPSIVYRRSFQHRTGGARTAASCGGAMSDVLHVTELRRAGDWTGPVAERLVLDYEARFLRRKRAPRRLWPRR
jgi:hypothetical protein